MTTTLVPIEDDRIYQFETERETYLMINKIHKVSGVVFIVLHTINRITQQRSSRALVLDIFTQHAIDITDTLTDDTIKALKLLAKL